MAKITMYSDVAVTIEFGPLQDGTATSPFTTNPLLYIPIQCYCKTFSVSEKMSFTNLKALCNTDDKLRRVGKSGSISMDIMLTDDQMLPGKILSQPVFTGKIGYYVRLLLQEGAYTTTYFGVVSSQDLKIEEGQPGIETVQIVLYVD
jgi:hypothetical protein